ncbi:hypothetical protein EWB00_000457, partial [Schistosoma japonicum]
CRLALNSRLFKQICTIIETEGNPNLQCGSNIFSKLDLDDTTLRIQLDETPSYPQLPSSVNCSSSISKEAMNGIVGDQAGVEVYQDDLIIN